MNEYRKQDLEERHRLGRAEYKRRLEALKIVTDDIQETRVALARVWLAEHYPDEDVTVTASPSSLENIALGFHIDHKVYAYRVGGPETAQIARELVDYFNTIGGFNFMFSRI